MNDPGADPDTLNVLGVDVAAVDLESSIERVARWIDGGETRSVALATAHGVMDARQSTDVKRAFAGADLVLPDGMSMVWLLRLAGHRRVGRVYGPDLMTALCGQSVKRGWSHFLLGGSETVNARLAARLSERFPGLRISGRASPPFRPLSLEENAAIVRRINASGANLVWIGLGTPKQDLWMAAHGPRINGAVLIAVGAAFDFLSGSRRQAPRFVQHSGFEWLFRLLMEPRRLWPRYARYPRFLALALVHAGRRLRRR